MIQIEVESPNGPVTALSTGSGPALVMVAGLGATHAVWGDLPRQFSRHFRVVTIDNRGVGGSRRGKAFSISRAVEDIHAVMDDAGLESASLLGASLGGHIALQTALAEQSRIDRVVAVSCAAHLSTYARGIIEMLRDLFEHMPPDLAGRSLMTLAFGREFHERNARFVLQAIDAYGPDPKDVPGTLAQARHLLEGWDFRAELASLDIPLLVLTGERDGIVPCEDTAEIAHIAPRATLVKLPATGHAVLAEGGAEVMRRVVAFLQKPGP